MKTSSHDLSWLDAPLLTSNGRHFRAAIRWFINQLPARAQRVVLRAARGELASRDPIAPVSTLREFIALPTRTLFAQRGYGHKTHADACRVFRAHGVAAQLSSDVR